MFNRVIPLKDELPFSAREAQIGPLTPCYSTSELTSLGFCVQQPPAPLSKPTGIKACCAPMSCGHVASSCTPHVLVLWGGARESHRETPARAHLSGDTGTEKPGTTQTCVRVPCSRVLPHSEVQGRQALGALTREDTLRRCGVTSGGGSTLRIRSSHATPGATGSW